MYTQKLHVYYEIIFKKIQNVSASSDCHHQLFIMKLMAQIDIYNFNYTFCLINVKIYHDNEFDKILKNNSEK